MADGTGNQFIEATNSGATAAYKLMINPVNGGNLYSGGNLEFPSGKGIDFSATSNSAAVTNSELFDDYFLMHTVIKMAKKVIQIVLIIKTKVVEKKQFYYADALIKPQYISFPHIKLML